MLLISTHITVWHIMLLLGIFIGILLLFFLIHITKGLKRYAALILFVSLVIVELFIRFMSDSKLIIHYPHLIYITEPFNMLYGLSIYWYARKPALPNLQFTKKDIFFSLPFILSLLAYLPFYMSTTAIKLADFKQYGGPKEDIHDNIWEWIFEVSINVTFLLMANNQLKLFITNIKEQFSDIKKYSLELTQLLIQACLVLYGVELISVYLTYWGVPFYANLFNLFYLLKVSLLFLIGYDAINSNKHIRHLQKEWIQTNSMVELDGQIIKYRKSPLNDINREQIKIQLINYMQIQQPYLQPQIRIKDLADAMDLPSHHISQVINESFQQNFYEFINTYRIQKAIELLQDERHQHYTYTAIGYEAGFNSKSTFYTAFKKHTGSTPAKYKQIIDTKN